MRVRKGERAIAAAAMAALGALGMMTHKTMAANDTWVGNSSASFAGSNWTGGNNPPVSGDSLVFGVAGSAGLSLSDNLMTPGFLVDGITFNATALPNSFIINPFAPALNGFTLAGNIADNNTNSVDTINDPITLSSTPSAINVASGGSMVFGGVISDGGSGFGLTTGGSGTVTFTGANTYSGNVNINGVFIANLAETTQTNPAFSALGNTQQAGRNINVSSTGTLVFDSSDTMGGNASTTIGSALNIAAGGVVTNAGGQFNTLGAVNLNGGTLTGTGGALDGNTIAGMYYLRQTVTVQTGGGIASTISGSGTNDGYNLVSVAGGTTTFNVGVTGAAGADLTVSAPLINTPTNTAGAFTKTGAGTMLVSGANTFTGTVTVNQGTLNYSGSLAAGNQVSVGGTASNAVMNILPGSAIALTNTAVTGLNGWALGIGNFSGGTGAVYQSGGTVTLPATSGANLQLGVATGGYGYFNLSGASSVISMNELDVGGTNNGASANGVLDITGGTLNTSAWITVARGGGSEVGVINMTGGTLNFTGGAGANSIAMGWGGNGTSIINVSNSSLLMTGNFPINMNFNGTSGSLGEVNIGSGGVVRAGSITTGTNVPSALGTGTFLDFNGGTLEPSVASTTFLTSANITGVNVYSGGATINNLGLNITISRPFLAPGVTTVGGAATNGISGISVVGGSGYVAPPAVTFTSNSGTGAAGYATINAAGQITGIVITNPGTNYADAQVVLTGGGGTGASASVSGFSSNVSGGLTFTGAGITTISNAATVLNTYTGATQITGGTIQLSGAGSLNSTSVININGTNAKLLQTSTTAVSAPVTLSNGILDGTTTLNSVTVANSASAVLNTGNGAANAGATQLTIGSLAFNGAATLNLKTSLTGIGAATAPGLQTTTLNTNATIKPTINITNPAVEWTAGIYNLIGYSGTLGGAGFATGTVSPAFGGRLTGTLGPTTSGGSNFESLTIGGFYDIWTGAPGSNWTTVTGNQNWDRSDTLAATDFVANDVVLFDDTATSAVNTVAGTTTVNIADAGGVSSSGVTFNNSVLNYVITSSAPGNVGIVSGSLVKSGTATATLNTANSYSGGTTINAGQLNINTSTAIGSGALTINGGGFDNTGTGAITLPNNPQTWAGSFTFGGTNPVNMGTGTVTLTATPTATVNGTGALTLGGTITDGGNNLGITKLGTGTLTLTGTDSMTGRLSDGLGTMNFSGTYNPAAVVGTGSLTVGTAAGNALLNLAGTVNVGSAAISVGSAAGAVGSVVMTSGTINVVGALPTTQRDIDLGTNGFGAFSLLGGSVNISGFLAGGITTANAVGIWNISGGPVTINNAFAGTLGATAGTTGVMNVTGTGSYTATSTAAGAGLYVGENGTGTLNVSGSGSLNLGGAATSSGLAIARTGASAVGTVNLGAIDPTGGTGGGGGTINTVVVTKGTGSSATFNFHGGTLKALPTAATTTFMTGLTNAYIWNEGGTIDNSGLNLTIGQSFLAPVAGTDVTSVNLTGASSGYINTPLVTITGGTVATGGVAASAVANINYSTGAITGITITNPGNYTVAPTGLTFTGGGAAGVPPTLSSFGTGTDTGGALTLNGVGTTTLTGTSTYPGGTILNAGTLSIGSASAIGTGPLTMISGNLNSPGATLTTNNAQNWNTDITFIGTGSLNMGTGLVTINASRNVTVSANTLSVGGIAQTSAGFSLTKSGPGTFAIDNASSYTGATNVNAGTLMLGGIGAINTTSSIIVNGTGAKLIQNSSVAGTPTVTLTSGTVDGTGTLGTVNVADAASNVITHGGGLGQGALTINNLNFAGAGTLNFTTSAALEGSARLITTSLSSNADSSSAKDLIDISTTDPSFVNGTYDLIQYSGTIGGAGFGGFVREATVPGLGARQTATLTNVTTGTPHFIALVVSGIFPIWTGQVSSNWTTTPIGSPFNWKLSDGSGGTEFESGDTVQFGDLTGGTPIVNVADNTVTPTTSTFINSTATSYTLQSTGGFGILTGSLIKSGTGTLTITNANSYSGNTTLSAGTLNINNPSAIGTGTLTITGGNIDSTLSGGVALSTNNPQSWNGDFSYGGTNPLSMGNGAVTLGGNRILTVNGSSTLTEGGAIGDGGHGYGITQTGPGTLILNGASTFTGGYTINNGIVMAGNNNALGASTSPLTLVTPGTVQVNGHALNVGGLTGDSTSTITDSNATAGTLVVSPTGSTVFAGVLADGSAGTLGLTINGTGTETLTNANTNTGPIVVSAGTLVLSGTLNSNNTANVGLDTVGNVAGSTGELVVSGGTINATITAAPSFTVGTVANSDGTVIMNSGSLTTTSELWLSSAANSYGSLTLNGGTINVGSWLAVSRGGGTGILNVNGGTLTVGTNNITVGTIAGTGNNAVATFTGGNTTVSSGGLLVAEITPAVVNVSGTAQITLDGTLGLRFANTATTATGMLNLNGGQITTQSVSMGPGPSGILNFNGGTLQASVATSTFMGGLTAAFVNAGGAIIDSNGNNITMTQALLAPTGSGVTSVAFSANGTGYKDTPSVTFSGGTLATGGAPASAIPVLNYTTGQITGLQITNPGDYTTPPSSVTFFGGGGSVPTISTINSATNVGGGLTKIGNGILAMSGSVSSTYAGPTLINQGTLRVNNAVQPVANYTFDDGTFNNSALNGAGVLDPTLNGIDSEGTATTIPIAGSAGPNGKIPSGATNSRALHLDGGQGLDADLVISNPITDLSSASAWTVAMWVQTSVPGATLFAKDTGGTWAVGNSTFYLGDQNVNAAVGSTPPLDSEPTAVRNSGGWVSGDPTIPVADGNWHFVTFTDTGTTKAIYVDGTLEALSQTGFTTADVGNQVELGFSPDIAAFPADGAVAMAGNMDEIKFYNVGLTAAQVTQLYTTNTLSSSTGLGLLPSTTPVTIASGAVLDLSFGQSIGSLASTASSASAIVESGVLSTGGNNTNTTFAGIISGAGGLAKQGTGTFTLTGVNTYSGNTAVTAGTLSIASTGLLPSTTGLTAAGGTAVFAANTGTGFLAINLASVTTGAGGLIKISNAAATPPPNVNTNRSVLVLGTPTVPGAVASTGGQLDLGANDLIVSGGGTAVGAPGAPAIANAAAVFSEIQSGRGTNGLWTGSGITSSSVAASPTKMALGMEFNDQNSIGAPSLGAPSGTPITTTFDGQTVADGDVLVKYTYVGDADLSGRVGAGDYLRIDNAFNYNKTASGPKISGWSNGDFNYDGVINGDDYTLIDNAYNSQGSTVSFAGASAGPSEMIATDTDQIAGSVVTPAVPEPTALSLLAIGAAGLLRRRQRKARPQ